MKRSRRIRHRFNESSNASAGVWKAFTLTSPLIALLTAMLTCLACTDDAPVGPPVYPDVARTWRSENTVPVTLGLQGIWGTSPSTIFAVGPRSTILQRAGQKWKGMNISGISLDLFSIWGTAADDVYALGEGGRTLHYDGSSWSELNPPTSRYLTAVWGSSTTDLYFVGRVGTILHYDGSTWSDMSVDYDYAIQDIWGSGPEDIYAATDRGPPFHFDGEDWSLLDIGVEDPYLPAFNVAGSSSDNVLLCGYSTLLFDGYEWRDFGRTPWPGVFSVWCEGRNSYYGVSRADLVYFDGDSWRTVFSKPTSYYYGTLTDVWGDGRGAVYMTSDAGGIWRHDSGRTELLNKTLNDIVDIWGSSESDVYAVGDYGTVMHFDGKEWTVQEPFTNGHLQGVWGSAPDNVFAIDHDDVFHFDGRRWQWIYRNQSVGFQDICGVGRRELVVVGLGGIAQYRFGEWSSTTASLGLEAVWGRSPMAVFAVGGATFLRFGGNEWVVMEAPDDFLAYDVWGVNECEVYAVGYGGLAVYDGVKWTVVPGAPLGQPERVWARAGGDLFVADSYGIAHLVGSDWERYYVDPPVGVFALFGLKSGDVFAGGRRGLMMRYTGEDR
jgi:hypothetical protein